MCTYVCKFTIFVVLQAASVNSLTDSFDTVSKNNS